MARRNKHSLEEIKEMVLDAAETIIINEGYPALTVRKIAMEIGYTVASIYMVFTNMADVALHIKANTIDELTEQLQQVPVSDPERQLVELAKAYLKFAAKNLNRWNMIFAQDTEYPEWYRQKIDLLFSLSEAQFALLAPGCSPQRSKLAARALWSGIHGICTLSLTRDPDAQSIGDIEDAVVLLTENFINGWVGSLFSENEQ
jgi:AcrR family transcriptional regulator